MRSDKLRLDVLYLTYTGSVHGTYAGIAMHSSGHPLNDLFSIQNIEYMPHFNGCPW